MISGPFLGADAVAAGLVTRGALRSPRFRSVFRGVYVPADLPVDLAVSSRAAALLLPAGVGALAGYSAAELLGASCAPKGAPVELLLPRRGWSGRGPACWCATARTTRRTSPRCGAVG